MIANKENISVRLKPQTISKIREIANQKEQRPTELMREILENYVKMH
ncbi:hypothetical protein [Sigmofec virus UA08Rod_6125]|uniref:Uncharacterized protein n=1 Tax=Sigmofec virus UA08Rod_6125 TaxID=2929454 RepID=A0A976N1F2_9VIRU|nr:hypothetical protein [Sigmofec virus UA08Rod_6125]